MTNPAEVRRLTLEVERAALTQAHLRVILAAADATVAACRRELRNLKSRIARGRQGPGRTE
jgi:hypothetical protein